MRPIDLPVPDFDDEKQLAVEGMALPAGRLGHERKEPLEGREEAVRLLTPESWMQGDESKSNAFNWPSDGDEVAGSYAYNSGAEGASDDK